MGWERRNKASFKHALTPHCAIAPLLFNHRYDFIPNVLNYTHIDTWIKITDDDSFPAARELIRTEGMLVGGSSGSAVAGAFKYLKSGEGFEKFGNVEGKNVVIILPDR